MQPGLINKVINKKFSPSFRFILNQLLLIAICSFLFQSFNKLNGNSGELGFVQVQPTLKVDQFSRQTCGVTESPLPFKGDLNLFEAELTTEDDEVRKNTGSNFSKPFANHHSNDAFGYNTYLNHCFLHLNSQVSNRASIPFFILYHAWKSDLS